MITLNKDRRQTKYGHKRQEHMTHTTEPWHNAPLPEGVSHAVTVPPRRGGGRSGGPSGQTRTGTQGGDLQSGTDKGGHGGAGSSGGHGGAGSSGGHGGAGSSGGHGGAGSSGGHGGAGSSGSHGRWSSWPWPRPSAWPLQPEPFYPQKNFPGEVRGYQEPSGARQTGQDIPQEQEALLGELGSRGFLWHDEESGALTGSLSNRFHFCDRGAGGWKGLPQTSLRRQDKTRLD